MARRRLAVDWQACKAHGVCAELLPEIVQLDEWGYPLIAPGPVPAELRGYAQRDPLAEYKLEGYTLFLEMMAAIRRNTIYNVYMFQLERRAPTGQQQGQGQGQGQVQGQDKGRAGKPKDRPAQLKKEPAGARA